MAALLQQGYGGTRARFQMRAPGSQPSSSSSCSRALVLSGVRPRMPSCSPVLMPSCLRDLAPSHSLVLSCSHVVKPSCSRAACPHAHPMLSCGRALRRSSSHALMLSCTHTILPSCPRALMLSCPRAHARVRSCSQAFVLQARLGSLVLACDRLC